jgi:hypothetical protein
MRTAVLLTRTKWTEIPRLRHQVARALAGSYRVLFAETPVDWRGRHPTRLDEVEPNIVRCRLTNRFTPPRRVRLHFPGVNDFVQAMHRKELETSLAHLGWANDPILVNFNHDAGRIIEDGRFAACLYICNDDWVAKAPRGARGVVARQEARVASAVQVCLAVSYPLVASLQRHNPDTRLFLPAHDLEIGPVPAPKPESAGSLRVVFMGNLNRRVEGGWLRYAAMQPGLEVHSIGTVEVDARAAGELAAAGVRFHEPRYGAELKAFLERADVLVIPYRLFDDVIAVTASNKLFSYLAAERPVVISDMPNFIDFGPGIIYRARSQEEFVDRIRLAASQDSTILRSRRREIALAYTWETRERELREIVMELLTRGRGERHHVP